MRKPTIPDTDGSAGETAGPRYTPYDGSRSAFSIGLKPLDLSDWIEPDEHLAVHLAEKRRLDADPAASTFRAESGTCAAQQEVLDLLLDHLVTHFGGLYERRPGGRVCALATGDVFAIDDWKEAPLALAGRLVQEDLCLLRRGAGGWRLAAASVSFPSHWALAEKFGQGLSQIHDGVPGYAGQMSRRISRIFDHLSTDGPVYRFNWSLHDEPTLHLPGATQAPRFTGLDATDIAASVFFRVEKQTLRKLPESGDILFTIKTYVDPFHALLEIEEADAKLAALIDAIEAMTPEQLDYKGLRMVRDDVVSALRTELLRLSSEP